MTNDRKTISDCYIFLLSKAYQRGHQLVQRRLKPFGITNVQYVVLEMLWNREGVTAAELGAQLMIDKATLSGIVERMTDSGLLTKRQDQKDRRLIHLFPSDRVNEMKTQLIAERKSANEELLTGFSLGERLELKRMLVEML